MQCWQTLVVWHYYFIPVWLRSTCVKLKSPWKGKIRKLRILAFSADVKFHESTHQGSRLGWFYCTTRKAKSLSSWSIVKKLVSVRTKSRRGSHRLCDHTHAVSRYKARKCKTCTVPKRSCYWHEILPGIFTFEFKMSVNLPRWCALSSW